MDGWICIRKKFEPKSKSLIVFSGMCRHPRLMHLTGWCWTSKYLKNKFFHLFVCLFKRQCAFFIICYTLILTIKSRVLIVVGWGFLMLRTIYLAIRQQSEDLKHIIPRTGSPRLQGYIHIYHLIPCGIQTWNFQSNHIWFWIDSLAHSATGAVFLLFDEWKI